MLLSLLHTLVFGFGSGIDFCIAPAPPFQAARRGTPGLVVLVGKGAVLDAATYAELSADRRVLLCTGAPAEAIDPLAKAGPPEIRFDIDLATPYAGDEREPAERTRSAGCIVLSGGDALDWYKLLTPGGSTTRLSQAIREAHAAGASVVGTGAAAPYLAKWTMVERAALAKPQRNPRRERDDVAVEGLGLIEDLLVDSTACRRGDPARALRAAFDGHLGTLVFLDGLATWIGDPRDHSARIRGPGTVFAFDLVAARRQRDAWREGRLSMLTDGDTWSAREGAACAESTRAGDPTPPDLVAIDSAVGTLRKSLERVSARLSIRSDERTRVRPAPVGSRASACALTFDLEWDTR
jgi:hypothetical protein